MREIEVTYAGLLRPAVGRATERLVLPSEATLGQLVAEVTERHGAPARQLLVGDDGKLPPQAVVLVDGLRIRDLEAILPGASAGVRILVMSPMMIGG